MNHAERPNADDDYVNHAEMTGYVNHAERPDTDSYVNHAERTDADDDYVNHAERTDGDGYVNHAERTERDGYVNHAERPDGDGYVNHAERTDTDSYVNQQVLSVLSLKKMVFIFMHGIIMQHTQKTENDDSYVNQVTFPLEHCLT